MKVSTICSTKFGEPSITRFYRNNANFGPKTTAKVVAFIKSRGYEVLQCERTFIACVGIICTDKV